MGDLLEKFILDELTLCKNMQHHKSNLCSVEHCRKKKRDFLIIRSKVGGYLSLTVDGNEYFVG